MTAQVVNTHEAKSRLSELIRAAERGDEVIVARNGRPVARIIAWPPERAAREPGAWVGKVTGAENALGSDDDLVELFEESSRLHGP